jgi:hypothetical protein
MTQVDLGLTNASRFDSVDSVISGNNANQKPGVSQLSPRRLRARHGRRIRLPSVSPLRRFIVGTPPPPLAFRRLLEGGVKIHFF